MSVDTSHDQADWTRRDLESSFATELAATRPDLAGAFEAALPGARSAILGRLWRALLYEPLPAVVARDGGGGVAELGDGRALSGPPRLPHDLDGPRDELAVWLDNRAYRHPAELLAAIGMPGAARLTSELDHSVASLALSRAGAADIASSGTHRTDRSLAWFEQSVIDGDHHDPRCRSRPGFSVADQLAYGPEHRPIAALDLVAVPARRCRLVGHWPARLREDDRLLFPVHPWQSEHVLSGLGLRPFLTGAIRARPLIDMRAFAPLAGGPHVRTTLTGADGETVDITTEAVVNTCPLSTLLADLVARLDGSLLITRDLAVAAAVTDCVSSLDLATVFSESPSDIAAPRPGETVLPVAALSARPADGGPPLIRSMLASDLSARDMVEWLAAFTRTVLPPLVCLLAWGAALPPHDQNLLVVVDERGRPRRFVYRGLADVRVSPTRLKDHRFAVGSIAHHVIEEDPEALRHHLFGPLVTGVLGSLVSALADGDRRTEMALWAAVAHTSRRVYDELPDDTETRADRQTLFGGELRTRALVATRLTGAVGDERMSLANPLV